MVDFTNHLQPIHLSPQKNTTTKKHLQAGHRPQASSQKKEEKKKKAPCGRTEMNFDTHLL